MALRLISFDAAGTLIQVREPVGETYAAFAKRYGVAVEAAALKQAFRSTWGLVPPPHRAEGQASLDDDRGWWLGFAGKVFATARGEALPPEVLEPLFDELYRYYAEADAWTVYDDVLPALEDLQRDHLLCVLSNFDGRLRRVLAGHGLDRYFPHVIISSEVGAAKPDERMFASALRLHDAGPEESLHVGDDLRCDIEGAAKLGWQAFHVERPGNGLGLLVEKVRFEAH